VPGIDFSLDVGKVLSVQVLTTDQIPLQNTGVNLSVNGATQIFGFSSQGGRTIFNNLRSGVVYRAFANGTGYESMAYDGIPCQPSCSLLTGDPIIFSPEENFKSITIQLPRIRALTVRLNRINSSSSVAYRITLRYPSGQFVRSDLSYPNGNSVDVLIYNPPAGDFYLSAQAEESSFSTLFPNIRCNSGCLEELQQGTLISIPANGPLPTYTLPLFPYPNISGRVLDSATGEPVQGTVYLLPPNQQWANRNTATQNSGQYELTNVRPGQYIVIAASPQHVDVGYPNAPCNFLSVGYYTCPTASLITVSAANRDNLNFSLQRSASIRGRTTLEGLPSSIDFVVQARQNLTPVSGFFARSGADYQLTDLPPSQVNVGIFSETNQTYFSQIFPNLDCIGNCASTQGTLVGLQPGGSITLDFDLALARGVLGELRDASTGLPIAWRSVDLWPVGGFGSASSTLTNADGRFVIPYSFGGDGLLATSVGAPYMDEVYLDRNCPLGPALVGLCPLNGLPIPLARTMRQPGIMIRLMPTNVGAVFDGGFER
jgi:hypothetical protein